MIQYYDPITSNDLSPCEKNDVDISSYTVPLWELAYEFGADFPIILLFYDKLILIAKLWLHSWLHG